MSLWKKLPLVLLGAAALPACAGPAQSVQPSDGPEWRRRADATQGKYEDLEKQVNRLLALLPRATSNVEPAQLLRTYQDNREVPELVRALEKQVSAARDGLEGARYRAVIRCGTGREDGSYSLGLLRKGAKPKAKGARIKLVDRGSCPSQLSLDLSAAQLGEGDYRLEVTFDSRPGKPYQFAYELRRLEGEKDESVCTGGTSSGGPPTLSSACDVALKAAAPAELPVAR